MKTVAKSVGLSDPNNVILEFKFYQGNPTKKVYFTA